MSDAAKMQNIKLDDDEFLELMKKVIGSAEKLQNHPPTLTPNEDLVADIVVDFLAPYSGDNGPLQVRKVTYVDGRSNVIVKYPGSTDKVVSFVGSHMDVVPANPEEWERDPFALSVEGEGDERKLFGRGVTDCLGHVCVLSCFFKQLAILNPKLNRTVIGVFIANEEASAELGVGIDELEKRGELKMLKNGPLVWVDSANFGPTLATGGVVAWEITVNGKKFHSGLPHKAVNAIEFGMEVVQHVQNRFYADFQKHAAEEKKYMFNVGSSMKPTQIKCPPGSINQIPGQCTICGDIRFTPFYSGDEVKAAIEKYIKEIDLNKLNVRGASKFEVEDCTGTIDLKWLGAPYAGVAVNLESPGYAALRDAVEKARGKAEPFSLTGSLPIIKDLQDAGYDVQITGFGRMEAYHANNEWATLKEFQQGIRVVSNMVEGMDNK